MSAPLLYESHSHTPLCKHAVGMPTDYAAVAEARGLRGITLTCHCPLPDGFSAGVRMSPEQYEEYVAMVYEARDEYAGRVDVRLGLESDYYPGVEPWLEKLHARYPLNHVLGSVHPQVPDYVAIYFNGDPFDYQQTYFDHLALAAESGLYDTLAHPDLIKNESPEDWDLTRILPYIQRSLDRIAATGVAMELNTSGRYKRIPEFNPNPTMLGLMRERGIPVVLGADAHQPERVAEGYEDAMETLQVAGYSDISFFLDRKRQTVAISDALASLKSLE
ncbi:histidinol-phosphatase [Pelagicoccus sp. SDUM812002]|uniref:histidinol-phosphatase n=1 Tax=Pelagicoccus sp. SDUM812002 TaxID=3041266 RepID=UPI00280C8D26|nr:histidinol-phosphatase [Pelagicoccus sp. SDUM812002]MDQ8185829.1 histidinol-phosphatase [Pelagicoccus sp. SDUM812002]